MRILITGGAGFIASNVVYHLLQTTDFEIVILDKFTYASGGLTRLKEIGAYDNSRVKLHVVDCAIPISKCLQNDIGSVDYFVHMAAGTHVDNSIVCPRDFLESNIFGTFEMLEYARRIPALKKFLYFSTDEVFGPANVGQKFSEWDRFNSCNPYAATKASGEELVLAWTNTYKVPAVITHCMNVIGQRQHHEKFLPKVVKAALTGSVINIHVDPVTQMPGSRNYIYAEDVASAVLFLLSNSTVRDKYNIGCDEDISNLDVVLQTGTILGKEIKYNFITPTDIRPGFDIRYGTDYTKLKNLGWTARHSFADSLDLTVKWMIDSNNIHWLNL